MNVCRNRVNHGRRGLGFTVVAKILGTILAGAAVAALAATAQAGPDRIRFVRFQMPSKNIGCIYSPAEGRRTDYLRCDILSGVRPQPRGTCELDWTGYSMQARGAARPTCAGDTVYARQARILRYGTTWKQGDFVCLSRPAGLRCTNAARRGFVLARARSFAF
jgi:hypothetical protein